MMLAIYQCETEKLFYELRQKHNLLILMIENNAVFAEGVRTYLSLVS